ncbi:MAG: (Fe-S)-binding protein [Verrucomicrobiaceae bacterium]|nr:(Fe-S)-binding protein [Verrucomicrobiaceae bacterium]
MNPPKNRKTGNVVNFMATCLCDAIFADAAKSAVEILKKFGCKVILPQNQTCCGQPAFNSGDFASARKVILHTIEAFSENDYPVIVPSGSCAAMLFDSALIAFKDQDEPTKQKVQAFAERVWELNDYLVNALGVEKIGGKLNAKVAVHQSCHTKGTGTPEAMIKLLKSIEGIEIAQFDSEGCCGFGGTFSVVFPQLSSEMGEKKVRKITAPNPDIITAADTSCLLHQRGIAERLGIKYPAQHVCQIYAQALRNGGLL